MAAPDLAPNPFPGLRPFEFDENHLFFGRDGQTDELLSRLRRYRFLAMVGTSGSGKSSLVRAGLLPDIHGGLMVAAGSSWRVALFKPGNDPIGNLARALSGPDAFASGDDAAGASKPIIESTLRRSALGLIEAVRQERTAGNLLIVADQFEEIFRFQAVSTARHPEDEATAFVKLLLEAARQSDYPIYVVLTMRSDYLGDCAQFGGLPEAINEGLYLIPRMTRDQRREAITGPVAVGGGEIAPRLVNRLLNDVGDNPDQLPIMQHALMRTWDCWQAGGAVGPIDLVHYERIGALSGALSQQADEAFSELTPRGKELAPKIFKRLTEKGGDNREVRRPATLGELVEVTGGSEEEVKAVIEAFRAPGRSFLMPPADRVLEPASLIDISHESLIRGWSRLRAWVDEEAASAEIYDRLAETAQLHEAGKAGLWRDPDLQLALDWRTRNQPTNAWALRYSTNFDRALNFLDQSQAARDAAIAAHERERRIRQLLRNAVIAALALGCIVSWIFSSQARNARKKAERAEKMALAGERTARSESLRVRRQSLEKSSFALMAERLVDLTGPEEAAIWQANKANALSWLHRPDEAIQTYEAILEREPEDAQAHFSLGYHYLVLGKVEQSLVHTDEVLRRDPNRWVAHQNRAIALAGLGRYDEAQTALERADETFHHEGTEFLESELTPEIQQATGRTVILTEEDAVHAASRAGRANFKAFAGEDSFEEKLKEARAETHPVETYLTAVNWCWLQMKFRPQDYGALAAQAAWWESAGLKPWAKLALTQFESRHKEIRDPRYEKLAVWVSARLQELKDEKLPQERTDADTLVLDAWDHENRNQWDEAQACLDRVIEKNTDNIRFLLMRAAFLARRAWHCDSQRDSAGAGKYYTASRADCDTVLKLDSKAANAYSLRAYAKQGLRVPNPEVEADLRKVFEYAPLDADAMWRLSVLLGPAQADEALHLLEQALKANIGYYELPFAHERMARLHQAAGRLEQALRSIETAIAIKNDQPAWYKERAEIEEKLGKPEAELKRHLADGYRLVGDIELKRAKKSAAFAAYWSSLEAFVTNRESSAAASDDPELVQAMEKISASIERFASKERAVEFWRVVNQADRLPALRPSVTAELNRLTEPEQPARPVP